MKTSFLFAKKSLSIALLASALVAVQACSSDGKKESRTEDAMEKSSDAVVVDAKDAQADAKDAIRNADEKLTDKSKDVAADFRRDRDVVVGNIKARTRELDAKIDALQAKAKRSGNEAKDDSKDELAKLKAERDDLGDDLRRAQDATADAWQGVKRGFKRAGNKIGNAIDAAGDELKRN